MSERIPHAEEGVDFEILSQPGLPVVAKIKEDLGTIPGYDMDSLLPRVSAELHARYPGKMFIPVPRNIMRPYKGGVSETEEHRVTEYYICEL